MKTTRNTKTDQQHNAQKTHGPQQAPARKKRKHENTKRKKESKNRTHTNVCGKRVEEKKCPRAVCECVVVVGGGGRDGVGGGWGDEAAPGVLWRVELASCQTPPHTLTTTSTSAQLTVSRSGSLSELGRTYTPVPLVCAPSAE